MDEIDNKIKNMWKRESSPGPGTGSSRCPGDEILSLYIDGSLNDIEKEMIERHLVECNFCLDGVLLHKKIIDDEAFVQFPDAPVLWQEKTKDLFTRKIKRGKTGLLDIILKFTEEAIEVISNPGNLSIAYGAPGPVRGSNKILSPDHIVLSKSFSGMESAVEVERVDDLHVNMKVRTVDSLSRTPAKVLRVSLFNPLRELASFITADGEVSFGNLTYGEYEIRIIKGSEEIGQISLNITLNIN